MNIHFLLLLATLMVSLPSLAYEYSLTVDLENGTNNCSYQYDYEPGERINICATSQDAKCLWSFNVDVTLYNLSENYGGNQSFFCEPTSEFSKEVLNMTVLKDTGFDP